MDDRDKRQELPMDEPVELPQVDDDRIVPDLPEPEIVYPEPRDEEKLGDDAVVIAELSTRPGQQQNQ